MLRSSLCDYSDAYVLGKGKITITGVGDNSAAGQADERYERVIFKSCASFTDCISETNNAQIDHTN